MSDAPPHGITKRSEVAGGEDPDGFADGAGVRPHGITEFGPYVVYECLGQGGMATVHRAEKRGVGIRRPIALKRLLPHVAADPELVKLFVDEARLASHLRHANVAQTYELGKVGNTFFIAMEYASGPTLTQIARQCQKTGADVPIAIAVNILSQVCEALDHAHNLCDESGNPLRLIHRDVSPANIIVTNTGIVKLIDFGIAKATISRVKTQTGFIKGKFGYIAPEYITGKIDARVDLFATGVIAHEMLTGRRLFEGKDDFETMSNIREMVVSPPSRWNAEVTPDLDDIVMTALERDPASRWQSAGAMQVALTNVARELGVVVGNQQLVEWVEWAFTQVPADSGPIAWGEPGDTGQTDAGASRRSPGMPDSVSIQILSRSDIEVLTPSPVPRRALSASDSDETVPLERVPMVLSDFEMLTPPAMAPAPAPVPSATPRASRPLEAVAPPRTPRASRPLEAVSPPASRSRPSLPFDAVASPAWPQASEPIASPPPSRPRTLASLAPPPPLPSQTFESLPPTPLRPSQTFESLPPPPPPPPPPRSSIQSAAVPLPATSPRPSRPLEAVVPRLPASREIDVIVVPPERMFKEPTPLPIEPAHSEPAPGVDTAPGPRRRRTVMWLVLLMIALGAGATAAAYYGPDLWSRVLDSVSGQ